MGAIVVGNGGDEPPGPDAPLAFYGVEADEVLGDLFERGQIARGVAWANAHLVIGK